MSNPVSMLLFPFAIAVLMLAESVARLAGLHLPGEAYLRILELILGIVLLFVVLLAKLRTKCADRKVQEAQTTPPRPQDIRVLIHKHTTESQI